MIFTDMIDEKLLNTFLFSDIVCMRDSGVFYWNDMYEFLEEEFPMEDFEMPMVETSD